MMCFCSLLNKKISKNYPEVKSKIIEGRQGHQKIYVQPRNKQFILRYLIFKKYWLIRFFSLIILIILISFSKSTFISEKNYNLKKKRLFHKIDARDLFEKSEKNQKVSLNPIGNTVGGTETCEKEAFL